MKSDRDIFIEALDLPEPAARDAYLEQACAGDAGRMERVRGLLAAHETTVGCLDRPLTVLAPRFPAEQPGSVVGRYGLIEQIGEGGFGVVYRAEQREPVSRTVALKIIKLGMDTREVVARFEAERQALALMDHPNIARVFDAGATETGRPFFVMELVSGVPITTFCDEHLASIDERLELFTQVCSAIQHAHQKGIIHRDIKPTNVLVTRHEQHAVPKVIDFGIAKATQHTLTDKTVITRYHDFLGTPAYMSPEQTRLSGLDIDTRTDIYSLGVLLYELLTGHTPFDAQHLLGGTLADLRQRIHDHEPLKPSTRFDALAAAERERVARNRRSDPKRLGRHLRGDLDWIVMKALEKDRACRYESASALAQDVRRYLQDEPVSAVAPRFDYRLKKFARRHRTALPAVVVIALLLVVGTAISLGLAWQARREAARARTEAATAEAVTRFLNEDLFSMADPATQPERDISVRSLLDRASRQLPGGLRHQPLVQAAIHSTLGKTYAKLSHREEAARHLRTAHDIYLLELGEHHEKTIDALLDVASTLDRRQQLTNLIAMTEKARALAVSRFGLDHPLSVRCLTQVAWSYYSARRRTEAFQTVSEAWAAARRVYRRPETEAFAALHLFARKHSAEGDPAGGEQLLRRAVGVHLAEFGPNHQSTFRAKEGLAAYLYDTGRHLDEAERMYREALAGRRMVYGDDHDSPQLVRRNLALLLEATDRWPEAWNEFLTVAEKRPHLRETHGDMDRLRTKLPLRALAEWTGDPPLKWRFCATRPPESWRGSGFDDSTWTQTVSPNLRETWARCDLRLTTPLPPESRLVLRWSGTGRCELFINGRAALREERLAREGPRYAVCSAEITAHLQPGTNVLALRVRSIPADTPLDPHLGLECLVSPLALER